MALPQGDDEHALTIGVPTFLERPTAIYSDFMVSHLSFGPQERGWDPSPLVEAYKALMQTRLFPAEDKPHLALRAAG